jgi:hypothetical protein
MRIVGLEPHEQYARDLVEVRKRLRKVYDKFPQAFERMVWLLRSSGESWLDQLPSKRKRASGQYLPWYSPKAQHHPVTSGAEAAEIVAKAEFSGCSVNANADEIDAIRLQLSEVLGHYDPEVMLFVLVDFLAAHLAAIVACDKEEGEQRMLWFTDRDMLGPRSGPA